MLGLRRLLNKPKLGDNRPLAVFYYCDIAVNHQMEELNHLMRTTPDNLDRRATLIKQLKEAQHNLMGVILNIVQEANGEQRVQRDFRAKYPDDVLLEQINGPIWFGAECIAAGSHIANHELESIELRPAAIQLSHTLSKVRQALRDHCCVSRDTYPEKLKDLLADFDSQWADFELSYVSLMCNVKTVSQYYHQQDIVVLFSEATHRAVQKKYISHDMIEMMDPSVMFAIPRLAIVCGLVIYPNGPLDVSKSSDEMPSLFKAYWQLLARIKELLGYLTQEQLSTLETALCSAEGLGTLSSKKFLKNSSSGSKSSTSNSEAVTVSHPSSPTASPTSHVQSESFHELDSRSSTRTVFEPEPIPESEGTSSVRSSQCTPEIIDSATDLVDSTAGSENSQSSTKPDSQQATHALPPPTPPSTQQKLATKKTGQRKRGPAGFASAEDLMHRLYIAISGVADQLQTNHAKDFRVILKQVFTICQSEPEPLSPSKEEEACSSPFSTEAHSPLIASYSGAFNFSAIANASGSIAVGDRPEWEPDSSYSSCSACHEQFSWRRRKHHCRNCGNVVCSRCSPYSLPLPQFGMNKPVRVCTSCYLKQLGQMSKSTPTAQQSMQVY